MDVISALWYSAVNQRRHGALCERSWLSDEWISTRLEGCDSRPHPRTARFVMLVYSLFDRKMAEYGPLVLGNNDEAVKRALREVVSGSAGVTMVKFPEDFDLYCLGEFDQVSGELDGEMPRLVFNVSSLIPQQEV